MHFLSLLCSALGIVSIAAALPSRVPKLVRLVPVLQKLDANADEDSLRYQPSLYFSKKNNCYHTAAIWKNGTINPGTTPEWGCSRKPRVDSANVYTRKRCNNSWCAYMYEYFFDATKFMGFAPRTPAWANVVVFVKNNEIQHVAASTTAGRYIGTDKLLLQDSHPLMVYQGLSWLSGHGFQFAKKEHVEKVENDVGKWIIGDLVGWDGFPTPELRKKLSTHNFGVAKFNLAEPYFSRSLEEAAGEHVPGFDCQSDATTGYKDESGHGTKEMQKERVKGQDKLQVEKKDHKNENAKVDKEDKDGKKKYDLEEKPESEEDNKEDKQKYKQEDKQEDKQEEKKDERKKFDIKEKEEEKKFNIKENVNKDIQNENRKDKEDKEDEEDEEKEDERQFDIKKQKDEDK